MSFDQAFSLTLGEEGGYSNTPGDRGGITYRGVTQTRFSAYLKSKGQDDRDVITMTDAELRDLAFTGYWQASHADSLMSPLDCLQFDAAFNSGPANAIRLLQEACGAEVDGVWGAETIGKCNTATLDSYLAARLAFYQHIVATDPSQLKFLPVWTRRLDDLRKALT